AYRAKLQEYLRPHLDELCEQCRKRFDRAPMRVLDCKSEACRKIAAKAPRMVDHLDESARTHFETVQARLREAGVTFQVDPGIVRGLDYYSHTAFEFTSDLLGAQSAL